MSRPLETVFLFALAALGAVPHRLLPARNNKIYLSIAMTRRWDHTQEDAMLTLCFEITIL